MNIPTVIKKIPIQIFDYDAGKNDSIIGTVFADFKKITGELVSRFKVSLIMIATIERPACMGRYLRSISRKNGRE